MKKLFVLGFACLGSAVYAQNLMPIKSAEIQFPAEAYKTVKNTQVGYTFFFTNYFEPSDDEYEAFPDKNGLYTMAIIDLGKHRPESFPQTYPRVNDVVLLKQLKLNMNDVVNKFKKVGKKQKYFCSMTGQMNAQFKVHYEGGDMLRFPSTQVWGETYSATPVGQPKITCEKA